MPIIQNLNDTVSSTLDLVNRANPVSVVQPPLPRARFALDASGVAGFFGGDTAVRAMATVYLIPLRRWLGWYNAPGAYEVAKQYSAIGKSPIFDALFPGGDGDPGKIFNVVDRQVDPEYTPLYSTTGGALSSIGPVGLLISRKLSITKGNQARKMDTTMDRLRVTFVSLHSIPKPSYKLEYQYSYCAMILTILTTLISVGGCIVCALVGDWFCFGSIAIGIVANGVACSIIGSWGLYLKYDSPTENEVYTPGDVLLRTDTNTIFFIGNEGAVRPLTHGRLQLRPREIFWSRRVMHWYSLIMMEYLIHISVFLLLFQFLAQLLLIPQGTLFGQLMFIGTLVSSWVYHLYLSTLRLDLQTKALFQKLTIDEKYHILRYHFSTRTEAVVFSCLAFRSIHLLRLNPKVMEEMAEESQYPDNAHREEAVEVAERDDTALKTLLFALLPGETHLLQAFRESLARKMSRSAIITYAMDDNPSFGFGNRDAFVLVTNGELRVKHRDMQELEKYQNEAQHALDKWRSEFWNRPEMLRLAGLDE